ncbi:MFS transporter [Bacillus thuringiensis]|uniref:MFS transporter n=1 Tax=Bacillus thuringiensis TaxID=1428 RepID=UPI003015E00D
MIKTLKLLSFEVKIMLLGVLLINLSTFMLSPFLALYMNMKNFSATNIGIVLTSGLIFQQGFTFFGGLIGDRFGYKTSIIIGLVIRIAGYLIFLNSSYLLLFIVASSLIGVGGALILPSTKASIASVEEELRGKSLALRSTAVNIGAALGPIIGSLLYKSFFYIVFLFAALTHILLLLLVIFFISNFNNNKISKNIFTDFKSVIMDRKLVYLTLVSSGFWFLYTQLNLTIPLFLKQSLQLDYLIGILFTINGVLVVFLQFHMISYFEGKFSYKYILFYGMIIMTFAFAFLWLLPSILGLYMFIFFFTVAEILIAPAVDNVASQLAPSPTKLAGYLGFVSLGWAIGGTLGNLLGGYLYTLVPNTNNMWFGCTVIAAIFAILFKLQKDRKNIADNLVANKMEKDTNL